MRWVIVSQPRSYHHIHSCQRWRQTTLAHGDIRSFLSLVRSYVVIETSAFSPPIQACRLSEGLYDLLGPMGVSPCAREPNCLPSSSHYNNLTAEIGERHPSQRFCCACAHKHNGTSASLVPNALTRRARRCCSRVFPPEQSSRSFVPPGDSEVVRHRVNPIEVALVGEHC